MEEQKERTRKGHKVISVCVISRQNVPKYMKIYEENASAYLSGCKDHGLSKYVEGLLFDSLDYMNMMDSVNKHGDVTNDGSGYLGCFYSTDEVDMFAVVSRTDLKVVLMMPTGALYARVKLVLSRIQTSLVEAMMNPFLDLELPVRSGRFESHVDTLVRNLE
eukprot:CAMPEP_0113957088 /NCGR_PEP_ID=MMETSP0011_2-20120614/2522_1 /TAXON_ID=101924 /ORGANISM="Rhodosorus marinus" /LENGTH=161 /DNA_ID=CAMNT_0000967505 /DNA_START=24 /DNA_END=509 /DNA_ORIENTATION=- /assembly_acc=CAM_ASM_000156